MVSLTAIIERLGVPITVSVELPPDYNSHEEMKQFLHTLTDLTSEINQEKQRAKEYYQEFLARQEAAKAAEEITQALSQSEGVTV